MDFYGFYTGKIFDAYEFLGAHPDKDGTTFRTFAPAASRITVIGEFNDWQEWELNKTYDGVPCRSRKDRSALRSFRPVCRCGTCTSCPALHLWHNIPRNFRHKFY